MSNEQKQNTTGGDDALRSSYKSYMKGQNKNCGSKKRAKSRADHRKHRDKN